MANTIRLKRASGSDPGASDLVTGELAVRTDNGKLFTKKDDGSVAEVSGSGGGIDDGDKGDITVSNSGATFTIDNDAVTYAKIQNVSATNRILGRDSSGAGDIEEITPANLRTMINVEDGATADQSASEIVALIADQTIAPSTIDMEDNEKIELGNDDDLEIYHSGSVSFIDDLTGGSDGVSIRGKNVRLQSNANIGAKSAINCIANGAVELYHDNVKKFETAADRVNITGHIFITDGSRIYLANGFGNGHATIRNEAGNTAGNMVFNTRTAGGSDTSRAMFTTDGHFIPYANDTYDLGSTSQRWRNVYTTDLQLSNEGKTNDVDGTWGDYTIQEGESDLFLINNRNGKFLMFNLTEVS